MAFNCYKETYLSQLPCELQDHIWNIVIEKRRKELHEELVHNVNPSFTVNHMETQTLYKTLIDYLLSIDWQNLHIYLSSWMGKKIFRNSSVHLYNRMWQDNEEHDLSRYVVTLENIFILLHDRTLHDSTEFGIRTAIMISILPLSYLELLSLCKYIKDE